METISRSKNHVVNTTLVTQKVIGVAVQRRETLMAWSDWLKKVWGRARN